VTTCHLLGLFHVVSPRSSSARAETWCLRNISCAGPSPDRTHLTRVRVHLLPPILNARSATRPIRIYDKIKHKMVFYDMYVNIKLAQECWQHSVPIPLEEIILIGGLVTMLHVQGTT